MLDPLTHQLKSILISSQFIAIAKNMSQFETLHLFMPKILIFLVITAISSQNVYFTPNKCFITYFIDMRQIYNFQQCTTADNNTYNTWKQCQSLCCPKADPQNFMQNNFKQCGSIGFIGPSPIVLIIVFCVMGFLILVLALICHRYKAYKMRIQVQKLESKLPLHEKGHLTISAKDQKWVEEGNPLDSTIIPVAPKTQQTSCSICLESKTIIKLLCQHEFHEECAASWFKKKLNCPFCRTDVLFIKVKCRKMCKKYMLLQWKDYASSCEQLSKVCPSCSKEQKDDSKNEDIQSEK